MDIEKLTKSQIILLTLLVSFVTSIATGIVTVSLMQQAPPEVAQTINRVIEHTIETVVASSSLPTKGQGAAAATVEQKTVVVDDSNLIAQAVKQASPSLVRIYASGSDNTTFLGLGIVIDASGTIVADLSALDQQPNANVKLADGTIIAASVTVRDASTGLLYLTPASTTIKAAWSPAILDATDPDLGQSVVMLSGEKVPEIAPGFVTRITPSSANSPETISTGIDPSSILPGSPLIDTDGHVVGVSTGVSRASSPSGFIPASTILSEMKEAQVSVQ